MKMAIARAGKFDVVGADDLCRRRFLTQEKDIEQQAQAKPDAGMQERPAELVQVCLDVR